MSESPITNNSTDATPATPQYPRSAVRKADRKAFPRNRGKATKPRNTQQSQRQLRPKLKPHGTVLERSGILIVDKPAGMTSHDVVAKLRGIMGTKKVGHSGTLDPMATGLLLIGVERGTKFLGHVVAHDKRYEATVRLGAATITDDAEGEVIRTAFGRAEENRRAEENGRAACGGNTDTDGDQGGVTARLKEMTDTDIREAFAAHTGDIMQRPAAVSAIKINGRRAHELVREGKHVHLPARPVSVFSLDITNTPRRIYDTADGNFIDVDIAVHCSSGTFIRSIARDVGDMLGVGGHLTALRRTSVGPFGIDEARTLDELQQSRDHDEYAHAREAHGLKARASLSLTLDEAMTRCFPIRPITADEARKLSLGQWLEPVGMKGVYAAVTDDGRGIALLKEKGSRAATEFVARPDTMS